MDNLVTGVFWGIAIVLLVILGVFGYKILSEEWNDYQEYKQFCHERPNFCYCSLSSGGCEYKLSWNSVDGLSEDTKALCKLAKKLDDKEMEFKAGCGE